ncbi:deoxyribodipyrimidine photo-lyase [Catenovulum sp. 2E275]|uniref:cryptochrome/photolyase family protein n=1 Tax=Catenovulum sp. 2E275 TaxID=2980497 RepID=UPI0021CEB2F6|nr:FAD-binding domain-containing protein [Catenovulum sp. 2E275]MCU4674631.1 deoxyribodipyrimidine photo-lyase [Catenovulum sp. 2E275]
MQLIWFRNDLRSLDHAGLHHALNTAEPVVGIFVATESQWQQHDMASIKRDFIYQRVVDLAKKLAKLNIPLIIQTVDNYQQSVEVITDCCQQYPVNAVHICHDYELNEQQRDSLCQQQLDKLNIKLYGYHDNLIFAPNQITKADGDYYKVFTAFKKQWLNAFHQQMPVCFAKPKPQQADFSKYPKLYQQLELALHQADKIDSQLEQIKTVFDYQSEQVANWQDYFICQESQILERLRRFCKEQVADYKKQRDFPLLDATSCLSPYLAVGSISPRQAINRLIAEQGDDVFSAESGSATWLSELIWREFYRHLTAVYPKISKGFAVKSEYQNLNWQNDKTQFKAWCEGKTGFPIVDAAMRQLNQTGWMHNRLRMITASFLVKDLQINWRWGEQYFMRQLIDGDYAANNGGWQWSASTGHDAAPYFRVFNPTTQSERFDPKGLFIKKYCPELEAVPQKYIHQPHAFLKQIKAGGDYPAPLVEHKVARQITLQMYREV